MTSPGVANAPTVIGDSVNLASRLEGVTKEYGLDLLVGEGAAEFAREFYHLQTAGFVQVKGREEPVQVFSVLGRRSEPLPPDVAQYLESYSAAMELYVRGDFGAAEKLFAVSGTLREGDRLAALYTRRCAILRKEPLPANWNGVYVMSEK